METNGAGRRTKWWLTVGLTLIAAACGGSSDTPEAASSTTTSGSPSTAPTTTAAPVTWSDADEILDDSPEQVLPTLTELIAIIDAENERLGATDSVGYDEEDQSLEVSIKEGPCTQVMSGSFFYDADVALTESPGVGILAPGITASVCEDAAAAAERSEFVFGIADLDQGPCPVDDLDDAGLGVRVCPIQPGDDLRGWKVAAVGMVDRVHVWISGDLGSETDPIDGGASFRAMLDAVLAHIDERFA